MNLISRKAHHFSPGQKRFKSPVIFASVPDQYVFGSVADPGWSSRIPFFLPIPDPKTATKERGEKKFFVIPFL